MNLVSINIIIISFMVLIIFTLGIPDFKQRVRYIANREHADFQCIDRRTGVSLQTLQILNMIADRLDCYYVTRRCSV